MQLNDKACCARCGAAIECDPGPHCWCARLPFRPMPEDAGACLCRACLEKHRRAAGARP